MFVNCIKQLILGSSLKQSRFYSQFDIFKEYLLHVYIVELSTILTKYKDCIHFNIFNNVILVEKRIQVEILGCCLEDGYFVDLLLYLVGTIIISSSPSVSSGLSFMISSRLLSTNGAVKALTASFLLASETGLRLEPLSSLELLPCPGHSS